MPAPAMPASWRLHTRGCACAAPCGASIALFWAPGWDELPRGLRRARSLRSVSSSIRLAHMLLIPLLAASTPSRLLRFHLLSALLKRDFAWLYSWPLGGCGLSPEGEMPASCWRQLELLPLTWTLGAVVRGPTIPPTEVPSRGPDGRDSEPPNS